MTCALSIGDVEPDIMEILNKLLVKDNVQKVLLCATNEEYCARLSVPTEVVQEHSGIPKDIPHIYIANNGDLSMREFHIGNIRQRHSLCSSNMSVLSYVEERVRCC